MGDDVAHLLRQQTSIFERQTNRPGCPFTARWLPRNVVGIAGEAIAYQFGINMRPPCQGMFQFFEQKHPAAFTHDKAIAIAIKGAAGMKRIVVARGEGPHRGKARNG